jgi:membrane protein DedA with SNARE-associated domain
MLSPSDIEPGPVALVLVTASTLISQLGLPLPAAPALVIAGALAAESSGWAAQVFLFAVAACLLADVVWFYAGRRYGHRVIQTLSRLSLSSESRVDEMLTRVDRWGATAVIAAKFVPGLGLVAPPLAGTLRMGWTKFLTLSSAGSVLWVVTYMSIGVWLAPEIEELLPLVHRFATGVAVTLVLLIAAYIVLLWWRRQPRTSGAQK